MANTTHSAAPTSLTKQGVITVARTFERIDEPWHRGAIPDYIEAVDHSLALTDKKAYTAALEQEEQTLNLLVRRMGTENKALAIVLQGRDGAGKTGATMRIAEALGYDYKIFASVPISAPLSRSSTTASSGVSRRMNAGLPAVSFGYSTAAGRSVCSSNGR